MARDADTERDFRDKIVEEVRPWGKFRSFPYKAAKSIKIITVLPEKALSLQYHNHRAEFWVVLDSGLEVTLGDKVWKPQPGEEIFIPTKSPHRLRCLGKTQARVMEIWLGDSDESDIVRLEDDFGRA
ncbi:MAG: phosphomannose isomerase type II C-terminal cupin domain [Candidatus Aminicenantales bacterium]